MPVRDYKDLTVWQKGIDIVDEIYSITDKFHGHELYCLTSQMRRAAVSIPSNVAEGFARRHAKEYKQFLYVASGSCAELDTHVIIASRRGYLTKGKSEELAELINHEVRMLVSLINKIEHREPSDKRQITGD
jgi:four helix bundle protein